jgi:hypothetical protein
MPLLFYTASICLLLLALKDDDDEQSFSAFDFLCVWRSRPPLWIPESPAPMLLYIMKMIEVVTKKSFNKEMRHES